MKTTVLCDQCGKEVGAHECTDECYCGKPWCPGYAGHPDPVEAPDAAFRALLDALINSAARIGVFGTGHESTKKEVLARRAAVEDAHREVFQAALAETDRSYRDLMAQRTEQLNEANRARWDAERERDEARAALAARDTEEK